VVGEGLRATCGDRALFTCGVGRVGGREEACCNRLVACLVDDRGVACRALRVAASVVVELGLGSLLEKGRGGCGGVEKAGVMSTISLVSKGGVQGGEECTCTAAGAVDEAVFE
jgi:hypothetical protein